MELQRQPIIKSIIIRLGLSIEWRREHLQRPGVNCRAANNVIVHRELTRSSLSGAASWSLSRQTANSVLWTKLHRPRASKIRPCSKVCKRQIGVCLGCMYRLEIYWLFDSRALSGLTISCPRSGVKGSTPEFDQLPLSCRPDKTPCQMKFNVTIENSFSSRQRTGVTLIPSEVW